MKKREPPIRILERKLGREGAYGLSWGDGCIEIDPRQSARNRMGTIIHEALHELFPGAGELEVTKAANVISRLLWFDSWRRIYR